jgi:hypothetical protein
MLGFIILRIIKKMHFMKLLRIALFLCFAINLQAQEDISKYLYDLPDVRFEKIDAIEKGYSSYLLMIKQPIDHFDLSKGHFQQKIFLNHKGIDQLNVIATEGYSASRNRMYEATDLLNANQINVEHRYFGESVPENADWKYLTIEQATADLHKIRTIIGRLYKKQWVSTGISKGGQTTIAYRYFYPDDVAVSMPYVAPLNNDYEDKRIYKFLKNVGTPECRKAIKDYQKRLLKNKKKILPLLKWYVKGGNKKFTYHSLEAAFELGVLEYSFSFWQWGNECSTIPNKSASIDESLEHFIDVVGVDFYSDRMVDFYGPHYYQASTQLGYYGFDTKGFRSCLDVVGKNPHASFVPNKMATNYDDSYNSKVAKWLQKKGNNFIYIYGEIDTWSATAVPVSDKVNSEWFMLKGKHHGNARIANFNAEEKERLKTKLEKWLGVAVDF